MLARRKINDAFAMWNRRWGAPYEGLFAHQRNNSIRRAEYPWCYYNVPVSPESRVLEVGGAMSGFQFVLAKEGARVTNVDPVVPYGPDTEEECLYAEVRHELINREANTDVRLIRSTLAEAKLPNEWFNAAFCISTIEHLERPEMITMAREIARVLKLGSRVAFTMDLFLDCEPFAPGKERNKWGRNVSARDVIEATGMNLVVGERSELLGFTEFDPARVMRDLRHYLIGDYPCLSMMFVLEKP